MSKILRRPMFRGGQVESRGTGITSGLDDGYATGGRVAAQGGGWLANLLANLTRTPGSTLPAPSFTGTIPKTGIGGLLQSAESLSPYVPTISQLGTGTLAALPSAIALAPVGLFEYGRRHPLEGKEKDIQTVANQLQQEYYGQPRRQLMADVLAGKKTEAKSPYEDFNYKAAEEKAKQAAEKYEKPEDTALLTGNKDSTDSIFEKGDKDKRSVSELTKEDVASYAKKYAELLGGEKADRQAIFDAMLAASPAFFKGKTLKEAAPNVFEAISKSGAFDKPRDIRQAAAQLAIQRNILKEKAVAEEKARLAALTLKGQKDIFDILEKQPGGLGSYGGNLEKAISEGRIADQKYYKDNSGRLIRAEQDKKTKKFSFIEID